MDILLTTIVLWLSTNFNLPAVYDHPRVEFVSEQRIAELRYPSLLNSELRAGASQAQPGGWSVIAVYGTSERTIYLPLGWTGKSPAESSALVHEMVHHLQNVAGQSFNCPQEREQLAYEAQEKWLNLMGRTVESDFGMDAFTLFAMTRCLN
jgi:hypothetical protein